MTIAFLGRVVVEDIFCWTDSRVALSWICGKEKQWEAWVENRVINIRKIVDRTKWHFVGGDENQADIPTRMASKLGECFAGSWFSGLPLLSQTRLEVNDSADDVDPETQGSSQPGGGGLYRITVSDTNLFVKSYYRLYSLQFT